MTEEKELRKKADESADSTENEEIIELTDEINPSPPNDDEIIELVEEVFADETDSAGAQELQISDDVEIGPQAAPEETSETASAAFADAEIRIGADLDEELDLDQEEQDDFVNSLGMDLETDAAIRQLPEENEPVPEPALIEAVSDAGALSAEQVEAAIERVIMKILPEKIDSILSASIERILTREIEKIKGMLLDDSSGESM